MWAGLREASLQLRVLEYVGLDNWLYIALISKSWLQDYITCFGSCRQTRLNCASYTLLLHAGYREAEPSNYVCKAAAAQGQIYALAFAWQQGCLCDATVMYIAASKGHLHIVQYLHENGCPWHIRTARVAAQGGYLEVLTYAAKFLPLHEAVFRSGLQGGHAHIIRFLLARGCCWNPISCYYAAENGHLEVLIMAHEAGCEWISSMSAAARNGHLDIIKYAQAHGCPWEGNVCDEAVANNHLAIVQYAHEHGCSWDANTTVVAAAYGHTEVLAYALQAGCPWNENVCALAARNGHLATLRLAHKLDCK
jgi:hypothetical protein